MIIDAHQHVGYHGRNAEAVVEDMDRWGIDRAWLLTWEATPGEYDAGTAAVLDPRYGSIPLAGVVEACRLFPDRFVPGYAPHPREEGAAGKLEAAVKMHGVRVCGEWKFRMSFDDPDSLGILRLCGRLALPVVFHLDVPSLPPCNPEAVCRWWYGGRLENVEGAVACCPQTTFLAHGPGWWRYVSGDGDTREDGYPDGPVLPGGRAVEMLRRYENLWCDLSALSGHNALGRDREFALKFIKEFQDRLLLGRDMFDNSHLELLRSFELPPEVLDKILCGNALRLVPLD